MRPASLVVLFPLLTAAAPPPDLQRAIDRVIAGSPALARAFVGIQVVALPSGRVLYERNAGRLFVPASNTKLFTTALALIRLGADYRFKTSVRAEAAIDASGTLTGDLTLVGGGDPSLSGREYPYHTPPPETAAGSQYSLSPIDELAGQVAAKGLKQLNGDVVGNDSRYPWEPYPEAWGMGDAVWEYGAPVSALVVNDNSFALTVKPGANPGEPPEILLYPPYAPLTIDNRIRSEAGAPRKIEAARLPLSNQVRLWGTIPPDDPGETELLSVGDPALFAASALRDALIRRGIVVRGNATARHEPGAAGTELAKRTSPPLSQLAQVVDKVSQNLHAELLLREVGALRRGVGSREAGLAEMQDFLAEIDVAKDDTRFNDGSGLSRSNLVTPAAVTKLLAHMYGSSHREIWLSLLPLGGVDGTLSHRFSGHPEAKGIQAKTGGLAHVRALSGYAQSKRYGMVAFSVLVNNFDAPPVEMWRFLDQVGLRLLK